jgi:hypothetical protein
MSVSPTPQLEQVTENITSILRLLLTQEVSDLDRILLVDQLEQILQSLLADSQSTVNVEFETEDNGERTLTISTTSTVKNRT